MLTLLFSVPILIIHLMTAADSTTLLQGGDTLQVLHPHPGPSWFISDFSLDGRKDSMQTM